MTTKLVWLDIETTGLDPNEDNILEIGIIITNELLNELAHASFVCRPTMKSLHRLSPVVFEMHTKNGLLKESLESSLQLEDIDALACSFIEENDALGSPCCGSTVHFDRSFLRSYNLKLKDCFHYRNIDVSVLKNIARIYDPETYTSAPIPTEEEKAHRVLGDLRVSIREFEHYLRAWNLTSAVVAGVAV